MRIFIPSYNRASTITTHSCFEGCDYRVLVHNDEQLQRYIRAGRVPPNRLYVTNTPPGLTRQREWAMNNLAKPGEWFVFADDNIRKLTSLHPTREEYYWDELPELEGMKETTAKYRPLFRAELDAYAWEHVVADTITKCKAAGARLAGFSLTDNPLFRLKKWRTAGYAIGKLMIWQHQADYPWDHTISMEDFYHTAQCLLRDGAVVVNNYVCPVAGHYEPGGMGPYKERIPQRLKDVQSLLDRFPGLFRVKEREGFVSGTELQLRLHSPKQIAAWRQSMGQEAGLPTDVE